MAAAPELLPYKQIREDLFRPLSRASRLYIAVTIAAFLMGLAGLVAWGYQLHRDDGEVVQQ